MVQDAAPGSELRVGRQLKTGAVVTGDRAQARLALQAAAGALRRWLIGTLVKLVRA